MKIAVSVESTNDLGIDLLKKYDIKVIPFEIVLGSETYKDGELTINQMFDYVDKNKVLPKTNAINQFEYTEYFTELLKDYDEVVHISLSSGLSSSCGNAINASKELKNVYVVDSQTLTTGIGLLAIYARQLADSGKSACEIAKLVEERSSKIQCSFVVERLDYLHKGGRCSSLALLGANLLKIRPRIIAKGGKLSSDKKYRGSMPFVIAKYCADTLAEFNTPDLDIAFLTYTTATDEMVEAAEKALKEAGFKNIIKTFAGGTVASHCGANTLGIIYFNDAE